MIANFKPSDRLRCRGNDYWQVIEIVYIKDPFCLYEVIEDRYFNEIGCRFSSGIRWVELNYILIPVIKYNTIWNTVNDFPKI